MAERTVSRRVALGDRFGKLEVVSPAPAKRNGPRWNCRCDCGVEKIFASGRLLGGKQASCGCLRASRLAAKEAATERKLLGGKPSPEYGIWYMMMSRCHDPRCRRYADYGGRGIVVCDRWRYGGGGLSGFQCFTLDLGLRPSPFHLLERLRNDGPYSPENCCWATAIDQGNNKRNNLVLEHDGRCLTLAQWARETGLKGSTIRRRLLGGWSVARALTQSVGASLPRNAKRVEFGGEVLSLRAAAIRAGMPYGLVKNRVRILGWPVERALTEPPNRPS